MFERKPLRTDVAAEIQGRIIDGRLSAGTRINESLLSQELGISRTPLREAMLCLHTEGVLASDMGRGFRVPPLTANELTEILDALAPILAAAVQMSQEGDLKDQFEAGNLLNRARLHMAEPATFCEHLYLLLRQLLASCPNQILRTASLRLIRRALPYVCVGLDRGAAPQSMLNLVEAALADLGRHDRGAAAARLRQAVESLATDLAPRFAAEVSE